MKAKASTKTFNPLYIALAIACILFNILGCYFSTTLNLPLRFDMFGTVLGAIMMGPVVGPIIGFISLIVCAHMRLTVYSYSLVGVVVGLSTAMLYPKHTDGKGALKIIRCSALMPIADILISIPIFFFMNDAMPGNFWANAMTEMMLSDNSSRIFALVIGLLLVNPIDRILCVLISSQVVHFIKKPYRAAKHVLPVALIISLILPIAVPFVADASELSSDYAATIFTSDDGLIAKEVNSIAQTSDGYIWAGSYSGLYRYDGKEFTKFKFEHKINNVKCLTSAGDILYVGTNDQGVLAVNVKTREEKLYSTDEGLSSASIRAIVPDSKGNLYIATTSYTCVILADGTLKVIDSDLDINYVVSMCACEDVIAGVTSSGNLFFCRDGQIISRTELRDVTSFSAVCVLPDGSFLAGDNAGEIYKIINPLTNPTPLLYSDTVTTLGISCMKYDEKSNSIFICGDNDYGFVDSELLFHSCKSANFSSSICDVMRDNQGNIWFASSKQGIILYRDNPFTSLFERSAQAPISVNSVLLTDEHMLAGTDDGLVALYLEDYSIDNYYPNADILEGTRIRQIYMDSNQNIWYSTYGENGLICSKPDGKYNSYTTENGAADNNYRSVLELHDGTIVAAGRSNGLTFIKNEKIISTLTQNDGLSNSVILSMVETEDGRLYCGSDGDGVFIIENGSIVRHIDEEQGLNTLVILRIIKYNDCFFYVTSDSIYYDDNETIRMLDSFPYSNNYDIYIADTKDAWITSSAGLYIVPVADLIANETYEATLLGESNGLTTSLTANSWNYTDANGLYYLCCTSGVMTISIPDYNAVLSDFTLSINGIEVDGTAINMKDGVFEIPEGAEKIVIKPAVLNYTLSNPTVHMYLEGYETSGITSHQANINDVVYTNLPYGVYKFHIQIINPKTGSVLQDSVTTIFKSARFFELSFFKFYCVFIFGLLIFYYTWFFARYGSSLVISKQYEELKKAKEEAEAANEYKKTFLANMSHEIRTPINTIIGMNEIMLRDNKDPIIEEQAQNVLSAANTLLSIVNDVLDFSKIEAGKMEIAEDKYDTADLLIDISTILKDLADKKSLTANISISKEIPSKLYGDQLHIRQIIMNLISNAVKYTPEGSVSFTVSCTFDTQDTVLLSISVSDTGIGIKPEDMDKLFQNFERLDSKANTGIQGTGLGLSITKQLLALMGSELYVESRYGEGSDFSFLLKQKVADFEPVGELASHHKKASVLPDQILLAPQAKILLVDDNLMNREIASELLAPTRIQIDKAEGGFEAIRMISKKHYDLILLDHVMPEMDGLETLDIILNSNHLCKGVPVIALTANALAGARNMYITAGFTDYLSKPVIFSDLQRILAMYLPKNLISFVDNEEVAQAKKEQNTLAALKEILDTDMGLNYCANDDAFYMSMVTMFCEQAIDSKSKIRDSLTANDIASLVTLFHSLKSSSKTIGAKALSDYALTFEKAAKAGDMAYITENVDSLLSDYSDLVEKLKAVI